MEQQNRGSVTGHEEYDPNSTDIGEAMCPYYIRDRGNGHILCECARFRFPDRLSRREIVYRFCAHPSGYKACPLKQAMDGYYERKYAQHE